MKQLKQIGSLLLHYGRMFIYSKAYIVAIVAAGLEVLDILFTYLGLTFMELPLDQEQGSTFIAYHISVSLFAIIILLMIRTGEYKERTINHKIIAGYTPTICYIAFVIFACLTQLFIMAINMVIDCILAVPIFGLGEMPSLLIFDILNLIANFMFIIMAIELGRKSFILPLVYAFVGTLVASLLGELFLAAQSNNIIMDIICHAFYPAVYSAVSYGYEIFYELPSMSLSVVVFSCLFLFFGWLSATKRQFN